MSVTETVRRHIVGEYLPGTAPEELDPEYDLLDTGVVDSLRLLTLIAWTGREFGVPVETVDLSPDDFRTVAAIVAFVESHDASTTPAE